MPLDLRNVDNHVEKDFKNKQEDDTYQLRRISALLLIAITIIYMASHDNNKTLEIIMLALAGFFIGASLLKGYDK